MAKQLGMPPYLKKHLENEMIGKDIDGFRVEQFVAAGNTAVTYKVTDKEGFTWALKIVTCKSYGDRTPFREISRFSDATDERFLVFPKGVGDWKLKLRRKDYEFIWFKSEYIDGQTLRDFLSSSA